uniref:carboxy-terminal kinesin 2-like n=1 Tax=Pristiophorus japonicus TaxID=55135 RepID=UPI00398F200D
MTLTQFQWQDSWGGRLDPRAPSQLQWQNPWAVNIMDREKVVSKPRGAALMELVPRKEDNWEEDSDADKPEKENIFQSNLPDQEHGVCRRRARFGILTVGAAAPTNRIVALRLRHGHGQPMGSQAGEFKNGVGDGKTVVEFVIVVWRKIPATCVQLSMDQKLNGSEVVASDEENIPELQPSLKKKRKMAGSTEAMAVKTFGGSNGACNIASNSRSLMGARSRCGARLAKTVQGVSTRSRAVDSAATAAGVVVVKSAVLKAATAVAGPPSSVQTAAASKKRPAWDLKGLLGDVKTQLSKCTGRLQVSEQQNRELKELADLRGQQLAAADTQITELQNNLQAMGLVLKNTQVELDKCAGECAAMQNKLVQKAACITEQQATIASLREVAVNREERLHRTEQERRRLHNTVQELKGNIRVICRIRPFLDSEKKDGSEIEHVQFSPNDEKVITLSKMEESHVGRDRKGEVRHDFSFDHVFQPMASQKDVFEEISQLVQSALDGYNVCIFAYGQTGSGKTFTMEGPNHLTSESMGMIPRAVNQIFLTAQQLKAMGWTYKFTASFLEIYNETLRDLLVAKTEKNVEYEIKRLSIKSERHVTNLQYVSVSTEEEIHNLIAIAKANRSVARTAANDRSSRSHSVFQLKIDGTNCSRDLQYTSTLSLVDLAGSERLDKSHSKGNRLQEALAINTSLSCLGHVIMSLSKKESHIPYRNSKLTYLLQNSLGGNSKMLMFVNVSPLEENFNESLNSLRFASKVNECVIGTAQVNRK